MASFLVAVKAFVEGLLAVEVPGLGISMFTLIMGLWLLYFIGYFAIKQIFGGGGGDDD